MVITNNTKRQPTVDESLRENIKIEQHESHKKPGGDIRRSEQ